VQHHFSVGGRRKDRTVAFEPGSLFPGERKIAVMTNGDLTVLTGDQKRLRLKDRNFTSSGVTHVTNGTGAAESIQVRLIEGFRDVTHGSFQPQL
jgi:hypothetical protein